MSINKAKAQVISEPYCGDPISYLLYINLFQEGGRQATFKFELQQVIISFYIMLTECIKGLS